MSQDNKQGGVNDGNDAFDIRDLPERSGLRRYDTKGGSVYKGKMSLKDLLATAEPMQRPKQPWDDTEGHRRWEESERSGHLQMVFKCQECSLEFVLLSLRSDIEALETWQPSHGQHGGLCGNVTCPECHIEGQCVLLGYSRHPAPIYALVGAILNPNHNDDNDGGTE